MRSAAPLLSALLLTAGLGASEAVLLTDINSSGAQLAIGTGAVIGDSLVFSNYDRTTGQEL
jgi:hypothetical protein